jgi:ankyrin repeat protein
MDLNQADRLKAAIQLNEAAQAITLIDQAVERGFDPNSALPAHPQSFENNWNVLFWASLCPTADILMHLVSRYHVNLEVKDSSGYTPLLLAAFHGRTDCVKHLVSQGADVRATSSYEETLEDLVLKKPISNDKELELRDFISAQLRRPAS